MKKTVKIISTILLAVMLIATIAGTVYAKPNIDTVINGVENGGQNVNGTAIQNIGGNIVTIVQVVGIVIAIVILLVIGIKYMIGSASEKAEYKKTMIPYIVGAVLIFAGTSLVRVIYSLSTSVSTK